MLMEDEVSIDNSEDDFDWEEVEVPEQHLEITIQAAPKKGSTATKRKGTSHAERLVRINCHKIHTISLLGNASIRNRWINDPLLHARLLSLTPLPLQNVFGMIHKSRIPDQNQRGRTFENGIANLAEWWSSTFFEVTYEGHIRNRTYSAVHAMLNALDRSSQGPDSTLDLEDVQDILGEEAEVIRSPKSLMKHALMRSGSRDTSAQLFTALCRAIGIPARLVVSLQSVPWQTHVGKPRPTYERKGKLKKGKGREITEDSDEHMEQVDTPESASTLDMQQKGTFTGPGQRLDGQPVPINGDKAKGKERVIRLRKGKSKGQVLGSGPGPSSSSRLGSPLVSVDPTTTPPVFWTEVFSRPDGRWLPVDPIRCIINKRKVFDPTPISTAPTPQPSTSLLPHSHAFTPPNRRAPKRANEENRMVYVLAFEEDGYARDVTRRYAKEYSAKIAKVQGASVGGKGRIVWWERVVGAVHRPYRLHRDDVEDDELDAAQMMEGMPTTISGFKDHPLYVLVRHLKQNQVIHPPPPDTPEIGKFRGEPVYPRSSVVSLKTAENWMRSEGRMVTEGSQALKFVKVRAGTINRMRELEVREAGTAEQAGGGGGGGEAMQGLYARSQTEVYKPEPVVDGKVPKNSFGNIDLYVPSMLPSGSVHVPYKGVAKIARKLGIDHAEAVTGFEFKKRRAFPILEGVVIAAENEGLLLEAYWEAEKDAVEKAQAKREERVIKHWTRLIHGLRIRQRLQAQYSTPTKQDQKTPDNDDETSGNIIKQDGVLTMSSGSGAGGGGGFLVGADDVVQPYHLPKFVYQPLVEEDAITPTTGVIKTSPDKAQSEEAPVTYDPHTMDIDSDEAVVLPIAEEEAKANTGPKTMRELAEERAADRRWRRDDDEGMDDDDDVDLYLSPLPKEDADGVGGQTTDDTGAPTNGVIITRARQGNEKDKERLLRPWRKSRRKNARKRGRDDGDSDAWEDDDDDETQSPLRKRIRKARTKGDVIIPARTLRPRKSKMAVQLLEEEEEEGV